MSIKEISKAQFKDEFEDSIALIEADYGTVYFRYFVSKYYGLGIAITYRFGTQEVQHYYYKFSVDQDILQNLVSAYVYILEGEERKRVINTEMIKIYNSLIQEEFIDAPIENNLDFTNRSKNNADII